ncbi:MAG: transposase [Pseudomonadota bacterium]
MPNKHNDPRRHQIPKARYKVENWPEYDRGLGQRGDIRFWISEDALEGWAAASRTTPGGQRKFSDLAIEATLVLGTVFKLPLRQTEGFVRSLMVLLERDLPVPDHTTLARRRRTVRVD